MKNITRKKTLLSTLSLLTFILASSHVLAESTDWDLGVPEDYVLSSPSVRLSGGLGYLPLLVSGTEISSYNLSEAYGVGFSGANENIMYVADGASGLRVFDITTPASPGVIASHSAFASVYRFAFSADGNTVYMADGASLQIVDITAPGSPAFIGSYTTLAEAIDVVVSADDNTAYVTIASGSVQIIDITDPADADLIMTFDTEVNARGIALSPGGNTLYVANDISGLQIIDITDPATPVLLGTFNTPDVAMGVAVSTDGETAYVADSVSGLQIIDITTPATPLLLGAYDTPDIARGLELSDDGDTIYIADSDSGLHIIDLVSGYSQTIPYITSSVAQSFSSVLTTFSETLGMENQGSIVYQVSIDDGVAWNYFDGAVWVPSIKIDGTETTSAVVINDNLSTLGTTGDFLWRAYFISDGAEQVVLDQVTLTFEVVVESKKKSGKRRSTSIQSPSGRSVVSSVSENIQTQEREVFIQKINSLRAQLVVLLRAKLDELIARR